VIEIDQFQVRGLPGLVHKVRFGNRTVDYWAPKNPGNHLIVAHDGQGVLDKRNIGINPHQRATWELGHSAIRAAEKRGVVAPTLVCIYHTPYTEDPNGRLKDYTPTIYMKKESDWMQESYGIYRDRVTTFVNQLSADQFLEEITTMIVPTITDRIRQSITPEKTALLGSSMGGLAVLYGIIRKPDFFHTGLSFSPHWVIGGNALAEKMMRDLPDPGRHKIWMSRGTKKLEARYKPSQDLANQLIVERGYKQGVDFIGRTLNRGAHSNATWAKYTPAALDFWLKDN
jgi:predicted alpha/beta superfamily hydrolase